MIGFIVIFGVLVYFGLVIIGIWCCDEYERREEIRRKIEVRMHKNVDWGGRN